MLGASWMTSVAGYAVIIITVVQQVMSDQPIPHTWYDWIVFIGKIITGVGIALSKDFNKSNAPKPMPVAESVNK